uniref:Uncharacterized protein n=1 Tax=Romanomermis culicivorax TaxID=13658 RepID=A0A915HFT8_ROMCU
MLPWNMYFSVDSRGPAADVQMNWGVLIGSITAAGAYKWKNDEQVMELTTKFVKVGENSEAIELGLDNGKTNGNHRKLCRASRLSMGCKQIVWLLRPSKDKNEQLHCNAQMRYWVGFQPRFYNTFTCYKNELFGYHPEDKEQYENQRQPMQLRIQLLNTRMIS